MFTVQTLNNISPTGLSRLPVDRYHVAADIEQPDAILVRSAKMHDLPIPESLKAVGRAGAGVNNIPVAAMSRRGIPVFNTPGANANAVKELVIAGLVIGSRHICQAWDFARRLDGTDDQLHKAVEAGKKDFAGFELRGRTLGVVGLGAIGRMVANAGIAMGMRVIGLDSGLTVEGAWQLSADVKKAGSLDELLRAADFVTFHVPLMESTRHLLNAERLVTMKRGVVILNFSREGIVDDGAVVDALNGGTVYSYVTDFPTNVTKAHPKVVALAHLGASTEEAEDNCAVMVVDQVMDFLEHGNIRHAVNFPDVVVPRGTPHRFICANANIPHMLGRISESFGAAGLNISDMVNMSRGEIAYTVVDLDAAVPDSVTRQVQAIPGVLMARVV